MGKITIKGKDITKPFTYKGKKIVKVSYKGKEISLLPSKPSSLRDIKFYFPDDTPLEDHDWYIQNLAYQYSLKHYIITWISDNEFTYGPSDYSVLLPTHSQYQLRFKLVGNTLSCTDFHFNPFKTPNADWPLQITYPIHGKPQTLNYEYGGKRYEYVLTVAQRTEETFTFDI